MGGRRAGTGDRARFATLRDLKTNRKARKYLDSGAREVSLVHQKTGPIEVHAASADIRVFTNDERRTSRVLPGFEVPVAEIFRYQ